MNQFLIDLQNNMEVAMQAIAAESEHDLDMAKRNRAYLNSTMKMLNDFVRDYEFETEQDEIRFFKEQRPLFYSEFIYWNELVFFESNLQVGKKWHIDFLKKNLKRLNDYIDRNKDLHKYYKQQQTIHDQLLFVRYPDQLLLTTEENPELDSRVSTAYSSVFSKFIAFERLASKIQMSITKLKANDGIADKNPGQRLQWTGTKAQLIELIYALASSGMINNGKITVKQLFQMLTDFFGIEITHFYPYFQRMRIKKKDRAQFLSYLMECLIRRMDESDEFPRFS
ncbi:RteC domain-containing protein [Chitinophaga polysaccharea]|uniref:RteC domain-containing protein n=1 Tax=Chitinophaga polysaccharea TaxID=1293035 RepID=UPI00115A5561|nr:RteC domain-containing protein [Chitinophaga polysaccharea]